MHQLIIDDTTGVTVTDHDGPEAARAALHSYAVTGDYYLHPVQTTAGHTSYELVRLDDEVDPGCGRYEPRVAGTATIEDVAGNPPRTAPYFAACEAQRWISDAERARQRRSPADPYPAAVLSIARGAAHGHLRCGSVASEAAALAGNTDNSRPDPATLETLRHNAITTHDRPATPAAIAGAVQQHLPAGTSESHTATLVWYYALILWGAAA
jgi:hypothetical protein